MTMKNNEIEQKNSTETFQATVFIAGPISVIEQVCREYCMDVGLCVTVKPTKYIYTGGEEEGAEIGLINYPRFPSTGSAITEHAINIGKSCVKKACQGSFTVVTTNSTLFFSRRDES